MVLSFRFARLAVRHSVRKTLFPQMLETSVIGRKLTMEILDCIP
jgi:hypothetical protein